MHSGLYGLETVLKMYNDGMPVVGRPGGHDPLVPAKLPLLRPLGLNAHDLSDLVAFLLALDELRRRGERWPPAKVALTNRNFRAGPLLRVALEGPFGDG